MTQRLIHKVFFLFLINSSIFKVERTSLGCKLQWDVAGAGLEHPGEGTQPLILQVTQYLLQNFLYCAGTW